MSNTSKDQIIVRIDWQGSYKLVGDTLIGSKGEVCDIETGLYQIYGAHKIYGPHTLLYIGRTINQIKNRIKSHEGDWFGDESSDMEIYMGYVDDEYLNDVEKLFIYMCSPAYNSQNIYDIDLDSFSNGDYVVLNFGKSMMLPHDITTYWVREEKNRE